MSEQVVICEPVRTPIGRYGGASTASRGTSRTSSPWSPTSGRSRRSGPGCSPRRSCRSRWRPGAARRSSSL